MKHMLLTLGVLTGLALLATSCASMSAAEHYRKHKDGGSLRSVLRNNIQQGDTESKVTILLGKKTYKSDAHRNGVLGTFQLRPKEFPDGVKETDHIVFYPYDERGLIRLIFRDGNLINHDPARYPRVR